MSQTSAPVASSIPLSRATVGAPRMVVQVDGPSRDELEQEGFLPGSVVVVTTRTPLGGPLIVSLGGTRIALSMDVAACVLTLDPGP
jgi:Fe2+ transport system protein FeoA